MVNSRVSTNENISDSEIKIPCSYSQQGVTGSRLNIIFDNKRHASNLTSVRIYVEVTNEVYMQTNPRDTIMPSNKETLTQSTNVCQMHCTQTPPEIHNRLLPRRVQLFKPLFAILHSSQ